MKSPEIPIHD